MDRLVRARPRRRGHDRPGSAAHVVAKALSPVAPASLGGRTAPGRLIRRSLAHAAGNRDDRGRLEFSRRTLLVLHAWTGASGRRRALYRSQWRHARNRIHASCLAAIYALDAALGDGAQGPAG